MRRIVLRSFAVLMLLFAITFGAIAGVIYSAVGVGDTVTVPGEEIKNESDLACQSFLVDIESVSVSSIPFSFLLGEWFAELEISSTPSMEMQGAAATRDSVDAALLGKSVCGVELRQDPLITLITSGDAFLNVSDLPDTLVESEGNVLYFPIEALRGTSIVINTRDPAQALDLQELAISGVVTFPQAVMIFRIAGAAGIVFLGAGITLLVLSRSRRQKALSTNDGAES